MKSLSTLTMLVALLASNAAFAGTVNCTGFVRSVLSTGEAKGAYAVVSVSAQIPSGPRYVHFTAQTGNANQYVEMDLQGRVTEDGLITGDAPIGGSWVIAPTENAITVGSQDGRVVAFQGNFPSSTINGTLLCLSPDAL